jgi:hypothetical protein
MSNDIDAPTLPEFKFVNDGNSCRVDFDEPQGGYRRSEAEPGEELCDWDADAGAPVHVGDGSDALLDT